MSTYSFAIIDQSDGSETLPQSILRMIADAMNEQLNNEFAHYYGGSYFVRVCDNNSRAEGELSVNIRNRLPNAPDAFGYHYVTQGVPDIEIGLEHLSADLIRGYDSLSVIISHEILELIVDPGTNQWVDKGDGNLRAKEICDPVEDTFYRTSYGVDVSNFLLPSAFIHRAPGPWDYMKLLAHPHAVTAGGYEILAKAPTAIHQVAAMYKTGLGSPMGGWRSLCIEGCVPEEGSRRHKRKTNAFSRTHRRGVRI